MSEMARLRELAVECHQHMSRYRMAADRRDALALRLIDAGETWRDVAEAAGFANPYIAALKRKARAVSR